MIAAPLLPLWSVLILNVPLFKQCGIRISVIGYLRVLIKGHSLNICIVQAIVLVAVRIIEHSLTYNIFIINISFKKIR